METINLQNDLVVFGKQVKSFPNGVSEAFDELVKLIGGFDRSFYGVSQMTADGKMIYYATALEKHKGEAEKYNCERLTIEKGEYLSIGLKDWRNQTNCIKDLFSDLVKDPRTDKTKPAVEWYKNDNDMVCMIRTANKISPHVA